MQVSAEGYKFFSAPNDIKDYFKSLALKEEMYKSINHDDNLKKALNYIADNDFISIDATDKQDIVNRLTREIFEVENFTAVMLSEKLNAFFILMDYIAANSELYPHEFDIKEIKPGLWAYDIKGLFASEIESIQTIAGTNPISFIIDKFVPEGGKVKAPVVKWGDSTHMYKMIKKHFMATSDMDIEFFDNLHTKYSFFKKNNQFIIDHFLKSSESNQSNKTKKSSP